MSDSNQSVAMGTAHTPAPPRVDAQGRPLPYRTFHGPDRPEEACAVFGIYAPDLDVSRLTYFGLHALQHRGQESAGIAVGDRYSVTVTKDLGLVSQVFDEASLAALTGVVAIGHTRYSTSGAFATWEAAQPHLSAIDEDIIALAHNGTLVNTAELRAKLLDRGVSFRSNTDSEVAARLIGTYTHETHHMREGIRKAMELIEGAYAMVLINNQSLYAFRDPNGIRPLCIGTLPDNGGYVVCSETCGLDIVGATYLRDVAPGEIIRINEEGLVSEVGVPMRRHAACVFEHVYFARPDSVMDGATVYESRREMGRTLAHEAPCPTADLVIGVPDSGLPPAQGYAQELGLPFGEGIVKNRYVGRTFIQPTQELRKMGIRLKLNPLPSVIAGKRLVVVDDSIVRGNTSKQLVQMLRQAGATEVHMRIVSPGVRWPCFYGIDTDTQDQLIAANMTEDEICSFIGADSLAYISQEGMVRSIKTVHPGFCCACFDGVYPVRIPEAFRKGKFLPGNEPTSPEDDQLRIKL